jgi:DNA-binding NarL/FixJ family response regulator
MTGTARRIAVFIDAAEPSRAASLAEIVAAAGHRVVSETDLADVVLSDGGLAGPEGKPTVALGPLQEGAAGQLDAAAGPERIDAAIRAVAVGLRVHEPRRTQPAFVPAEDATHPLLTPRETDVLAALGEGLSNKAIARRLALSPHTVKFYLESLFRKLDATGRADAVAKGLRRQLIEL